jgi:hypothetical protein
MLLLMAPLWGLAQNDSETIKKSFTVTDLTEEMWFCVCNIEGDVEVEAYDGNTIEIEVNKKIRARRDEDIAEGMKDVQVEFVQGEGFVRARLETPFNQFKERDDSLACGWQWDRNGDRVYYRYRVDFKVKVPRNISVKISTVNNSDLFIKGVKGQIYANNVNGDVELTDIANDTKAHTVNGKINVSYTSMPREFADFETINGDIVVYTAGDASGIYSFETQYGEVYSDLDFNKKLAPKMVSGKGKNGGSMYKIANSNSYQAGNGGGEISFKTLNGDIRIKKGK